MLEFVIPTSKDELLTQNGRKYIVNKVLKPSDLTQNITVCKQALMREGYTFILEHFDGLFSIIVHSHKVEWDVLIKGWCIILQGVRASVQELDVLLRPNKELHADVRNPACNALKMLMYLFTQLLNICEDHMKNAALGRAKRKGSQQQSEEQIQWQDQLRVGTCTMSEVLQLPLLWLWDPPVVEESFLHLFGDSGSMLLENPQSCTVKYAAIRETVLHMYGSMARRYNYGFSLVIRMVLLLGRFDHVAGPLVQCIKLLQEEYGVRHMSREVLQEVKELYTNEVLAPAAKAHGLFIGELAEVMPASMEEHIDQILHLVDESHLPLRNGILTAITAVVIHCLSPEKEEPPAPKVKHRNELLDVLLEHLQDPSAIVRSKSLSLWKRLAEEHAVPSYMKGQLVEAVIRCILDTTSSVRKHAIQLLSTFLKQCPILAQEGIDKMEVDLQKQLERLDELKTQYREGTPREKRQAAWEQIRPSLQVVLKKLLEAAEEDEAAVPQTDDDDEETHQEALDRYHGKLIDALERKAFKEAFKHACALEALVPDFDKLKGSDLESQLDFYLGMMGNIYVEQSLRTTLTDEEQAAIEQGAEQLRTQQYLVNHYEDAILFMNNMRQAVATLEKMLAWSMHQQGPAIADGVVEAVEVLQLAHAVALPGAEKCVRVTMELVLHEPEQSVITAIANTVKVVYFASAGQAGMAPPERTVLSLIKLMSTATRAEYSALEELMKVWVQQGDINGHSIQMMWQVFKNPELAAEPEQPRERRLLALLLLKLVAPIVPQKVHRLLPEMSQLVLSPPTNPAQKPDLLLAEAACETLRKTCPPIQHNYTAAISSFKLPVEHELFAGLLKLLQCTFTVLEDGNYVPLLISALNLAFQMCLGPEIFTESILQFMFKTLQDMPTNTQGATPTGNKVVVPHRLVVRLVSAIGHAGMMGMIFLDTSVYKKLKDLEEEACEKKEAEKKAKGKGREKGKRTKSSRSDSTASDRSSNTSRKGSTRNRSTRSLLEETNESIDGPQSQSSNDGDDVTGATSTQAEDRIAESLRTMAETELLSPDHILGQLQPTVVEVCSKPKMFHQPDLQRAGLLALSKLMMVSSIACSDHMQLFVTAMSRAEDEHTRAQGVIAMADITFRFPNVVEPWTKFLYERLHDDSEKVRLTAIIILSRLIMCEMIKVRGQVADLALCICDSVTSISNAARSFFTELSNKGHILYNVLPDIISRLSAPSTNLSEATFKEIIKFILDLVKVNRQLDMLVDKLCQRFPMASTDRQAADVALCLSLLPLSAKGLQKLVDHMPLYTEKLHLPKVYNCFASIITDHSKSSAKPEIKTAAEDLKSKIEIVLKAGTEGGEEMALAAARLVRATPKKGKSGTPRKTPAKTPATVSRRGKKKARGAHRIEWSSDEEDLPPIEEERKTRSRK